MLCSDKKAFCPHRVECSGCVCDDEIANTWSRACTYFSRHGISGYTIIRGPSIGWRTRVKLAVRQQGSDGLAIGLFRRQTHEVVSIPDCCAHHPAINEAVALVATLSPHLGYEEHTNTGHLKYLQAVVERSTKKVQLTFVLNIESHRAFDIEAWGQRANSFFSSYPNLFHSFWINLHPKASNTIFGPTWMHVVGDRMIFETLCGCEIPYLPSHFAQANLDMFERLLKDLVSILPANAQVIELFAGMGVISLVIRNHCRSITAVERDESAKDAFMVAKQRLPECQQHELNFVVADASACLEILERGSTVIVDPPRKGLTSTLVSALSKNEKITTVLYISCHFPSLERDLEDLIIQGGFRIAFARSYIFFPGTDQIETLVKLVR